MRSVLALALAAALVPLAGCGPNCTAKLCPAVLTLHVDDAAGKPVRRFNGTLDLDGRVFDFVCSADNLGSGGHFSCDAAGVVTFPGFGEAGGHYRLTVTDDDTRATFSGPLDASNAKFDTVADWNGKGCGSCSTGDATVTLKQP